MRNYINSAPPQLLSSPINSSEATLNVTSTNGFPDAPFILAIDRGLATEEVVLCTEKTSTTFTVTRGYDGTTGVSHSAGATVEHTTAAIDYRESGIVRIGTTGRDNLTGDDAWDGRTVWNTDSKNLEVSHPDGWVPVVPIGTALIYFGSDQPPGWLRANGQAVSRTDYPFLFGMWGTTYGVGDGSTTFNVPDMRQRFPLGVAASGTGNALGQKGGAIDHTHTNSSTGSAGAHSHTVGNTNSTGSHSHTVTVNSGGSHSHTISGATAAGGSHNHGSRTALAGGHSHTVGNTGSAGSHSHSTGGPSSPHRSANAYHSGNQGGSVTVASSTHTHSTGSAGSHTHSVPNTSTVADHRHDIPTADPHTHGVGTLATNSTGSHTHTASTNSTGSHSHTVGDTNSTGDHTHTVGDTGANNPPFIAVNFIIKAG